MKRLLASPEYVAKLKKIKLFAVDVDGVLTDGKVFWLGEDRWTRSYNIKDGYGFNRLQRAGIEVLIITAGQSMDMIERMKVLQITNVLKGDRRKWIAFDQFCTEKGFTFDQVAYIGDDLFDLPILKKVGFSATVPDAIDEVKESVDYITDIAGGMGATREISEAILKVQNLDVGFDW